MTRLDRFLSLFAEPWCRFELTIRRVWTWADSHTPTYFARVTDKEGE